MGRAVSDAGSSGNPWATPVSGNTSPGSFGALINDLGAALTDIGGDVNSSLSDLASLEALSDIILQKITELHKLQGLDVDHPMTVTTTSRTVDDITLTITGDGVTTSTVTRS